MRLMKIAAGALNQAPKRWRHNRENIVAAINAAKKQGIELLALPELCITGYGCEDLFLHPWVAERAWKELELIAKETAGIAVLVGLPVIHRRKQYNGAALLVNGAIAGIYCKKHLAGDGLHYEPRWFHPWTSGVVDQTTQGVPIGDITVEVNGVIIGFETCQDAWVANRPGHALARRGVDVILNPSASHFSFGKHTTRVRFVEEGSRAFCAAYVYSNLLGNEAGRAIYDGDCLIASCGRVVALGERFSFEPFTLTAATVSITANRNAALGDPSFVTDLTADASCISADPFDAAAKEKVPTAPVTPVAWELLEGIAKKDAEFVRCASLALWDYTWKSKMFGYLVSLSGGADSTASAALVRLMFDQAQAALGDERFFERVLTIPGTRRDHVVARMLQTVYEPTSTSGSVTQEAARTVAAALGAKFDVVPVEAIRHEIVSGVEKYIGRKLDWTTDDIALQNASARARPGVAWGIANVERLIFLNTSNRSEAAVGYCTMDGDTSGTVNAIGGVDKDYLRGWLKRLERGEVDGAAAIPALRAVNVQQPTAELRPQAAQQTDEQDLMPYPVLNRIEQLFAVERCQPLEIYDRLCAELSGSATAEQVLGWVQKFFQLCPRSQHKRERLAISFHYDDHNLDPRTWFRFPILAGDFDEELEELVGYANVA